MSRGTEMARTVLRENHPPRSPDEEELPPVALCVFCTAVVKSIWPHGVMCAACLCEELGVSVYGGRGCADFKTHSFAP